MQRRATASPERRLGCPTSASGTTSTQRPSVITQATVDTAPISRLELEAQSAATAKQTAPPRPPAIAIIRMQLFRIAKDQDRSEEHTSELQSLRHLVCR